MKKGFSLTEIIITMTIIGILSLLGLNYVKKNAANYDPLFYYSAYDTLTKSFADAVDKNVPLTSIDLCNYFLELWNVDTTRSHCGLEVAMVKPSKTGFINPVKNDFLDVIANKILSTAAYAVQTGMGYIKGRAMDGSITYTPSFNGEIPEIDEPEGCVYYTFFDMHYYYNQSLSPAQCVPKCNCTAYSVFRQYPEDYHYQQFVDACVGSPNAAYPGRKASIEDWESDCYPEDDPPAPGYGNTLTGTIYTSNGLQYDFYSGTQGMTIQLSVDDVLLDYFSIKVSKTGNNNLQPVYFLIYPITKELIPVSPQLIDNKNLLPTYLTSDYNGSHNNAVTKYTTYRSARCEKYTKIPGSNDLKIPPAHIVYNRFVYSSQLNTYPNQYCGDNVETINWLKNSAVNDPRESLEIKTDSPNGIR